MALHREDKFPNNDTRWTNCRDNTNNNDDDDDDDDNNNDNNNNNNNNNDNNNNNNNNKLVFLFTMVFVAYLQIRQLHVDPVQFFILFLNCL